jgi:hypothetical protein
VPFKTKNSKYSNMKNTIIYIMILFSATLTFGQTGIRAGLNMANEIKSFSFKDISASFSANNLTGYQIGVVQQFMSKKTGFGGEIGVLLSQKGYIFTDSETAIKCYKEINFFEIPLNLRYQVKFGFLGIFAYGGGYAAYSLSGKIVTESNPPISQPIDYLRFYDHFDYGYNIGVGLEFFKKFQLAGVWSQGLKNTSINPDDASMNRVLSVNLTYLF